MSCNESLKLIAFYLPQYHPVPENDEWWGKGFTEWTNVTKARPLISGHYQPHLPADLGFYDLRLPEARQAQADLAKAYGIDAFCYYHYWFNGKKPLSQPFDEVLNSREPDLPFCLCWANENWTRAWDGRSGQVLLQQNYSHDDDQKHIEHLLPALADERYIRVGNRPLLLVYRTELLPDPARTAELWRNATIKAGLGDICLARVESFQSNIDPTDIGFDAAVEFAPDWRVVRPLLEKMKMRRFLSKLGLMAKGYREHRFADYGDLANDMLSKPDPGYCRYPCVTPGFDNSPRRAKDAQVFLNSTPELYGSWLKDTITAEHNRQRHGGEHLVFVNAWNEWAEGNHLEPDLRWGRSYLEAQKKVLQDAGLLI